MADDARNLMTDEATTQRRMLRGVMIAVGVWGGLLSLGALIFGRNPETGDVTFSVNPLRGLIVFACVAGFLGFWSLLLANQKRKPEAESKHKMNKPPDKP